MATYELYIAARSTVLNMAPPLAKLLTSAIGPGASTDVVASLSVRAASSGVVKPEMGGTRPRRPQRRAAAHDAPPDAPDSPSDPFSDVTTVGADPNSAQSASASTASSARVAFDEAYTT